MRRIVCTCIALALAPLALAPTPAHAETSAENASRRRSGTIPARRRQARRRSHRAHRLRGQPVSRRGPQGVRAVGERDRPAHSVDRRLGERPERPRRHRPHRDDRRLITLASSLGRAFALNPGSHRISAVHGSDPPADETIMLREGKQARVVNLVITSTETVGPNGIVRPPRTRRVPALSYVLGGVAVVGVGGFAYFWAAGMSKVGDLRRTCQPFCPKAQIDDAECRSTSRASRLASAPSPRSAQRSSTACSPPPRPRAVCRAAEVRCRSSTTSDARAAYLSSLDRPLAA